MRDGGGRAPLADVRDRFDGPLEAVVDDAERVQQIARQIVENLRSPDILGLQEMQDLDGEGPLGPAGDPTFAALVQAIADQGAPAYQFRQIDPVNNADGGAPNSNIRVGFLFRPDRASFVDKPGGTAVTATEDDPAQPGAQLTFSPGRIEPEHPVWQASRKPLAGEFRFRGRTVIVVSNHFNSQGGDAPLFGRGSATRTSSRATARCSTTCSPRRRSCAGGPSTTPCTSTPSSATRRSRATTTRRSPASA